MLNFIDQYDIIDSEGNIIVSCGRPEHLKVKFDEIKSQGINVNYPCKAVSRNYGIDMEITEEITTKDWRDFNYRCAMAKD